MQCYTKDVNLSLMLKVAIRCEPIFGTGFSPKASPHFS